MCGNFLDYGHEAWGEWLRSRWREPIRIEYAQKTADIPVDEEETARRREYYRAGGTTIPHPIIPT